MEVSRSIQLLKDNDGDGIPDALEGASGDKSSSGYLPDPDG